MSESNKPGIAFFEKYLTVWVLLCIGVGILVGEQFSQQIVHLQKLEIYSVNIPVAILIWFMIYPMMVQVDFSSIKHVKRNPRGLIMTLIVNWLIKPFTMAFFAWLFFENIFQAFLSPQQAQEYIAGAILLGAAPCTAMVFVWSYLSRGDANYTLIQVSVNDIVLLFAFIPIVKLLLGVTDIRIPSEVLATSVITFVLIPLLAGILTQRIILNRYGKEWMGEKFLPKLRPLSISALLLTLVLLFAFQGQQIIAQPFNILIIAIPLAIQTYFIFFLAWFSGKFVKIPYQVCAPAAMIGASNFFELAVAVSISLFGLESGATLATVVGVLIEVPIMLSLVAFANRFAYN